VTNAIQKSIGRITLVTKRKKSVKRKPVKKKTVKKKPKKKQAVGRPAFEATDKLRDIAYQAAKKGLNESEIAQAMGISYATLQRNKDEFSKFIKKGREEVADGLLERVESSLLKRCEGFYIEETTTERRGTVDANNKFTGSSLAVQKKFKKYIAPSDMAIVFYLVNRSKGKWESINRRDYTSENDKGAILDAIEKMKKNPV